MTTFSTTYPRFLKASHYPPSNQSEVADKHPSKKLELEFIHGCSKKGCKGTYFHVNDEHELVYPAAGCGVVFDVPTNTQKIFRKHDDDVVCIAKHLVKSKCKMLLSAELYDLAITPDDRHLYVCGKKTLKIFNTADLSSRSGVFGSKGTLQNTYCVVFVGPNESVRTDDDARSSNSSSTSTTSSLDALVGVEDGSLYLFRDGKVIQSFMKAHEGAIYCMTRCQLPLNDQKGSGIVSSGKDGVIKWWRYHPQTTQLVLECSLQVGGCVKAIVATCSPWSTTTATTTTSLTDTKDTTTPTTDATRTPTTTSPSTTPTGDRKDKVPLVYISKSNGDLQCITNFTQVNTLLASHCGLSHLKQLWGLAIVKGSSKFMTAGDDGRIIVWDSETRKHCAQLKIRLPLHSIPPSSSSSDNNHSSIELRGIAISPQYHVAVTKPLFYRKDSIEEIATLQYSNDGSLLVCGSHDNYIYMYQCENSKKDDCDLQHDQNAHDSEQHNDCTDQHHDNYYHILKNMNQTMNYYNQSIDDNHTRLNYKWIGKLSGHSSFVTHLDISKDGKYIRSNSGDYEILLWEVETRKQINSMMPFIEDIEWDTLTCPLGYTVRGIWKPEMDGSDINAIDVSFEHSLVACGEDSTQVSLYHYPRSNMSRFGYSEIGHCSHVTNVKFTGDGKKLLSCGGGDLTILQWSLKDQQDWNDVNSSSSSNIGKSSPNSSGSSSVTRPIISRDQGCKRPSTTATLANTRISMANSTTRSSVAHSPRPLSSHESKSPRMESRNYNHNITLSATSSTTGHMSGGAGAGGITATTTTTTTTATTTTDTIGLNTTQLPPSKLGSMTSPKSLTTTLEHASSSCNSSSSSGAPHILKILLQFQSDTNTQGCKTILPLDINQPSQCTFKYLQDIAREDFSDYIDDEVMRHYFICCIMIMK